MVARVCFASLILLSLAAVAPAQVVRFETTVGSFDMVLNPTNNPRLRGHVDNMLQYVNNNSYNSSWINRADTGFVLQMGGFHSHTKRPPASIVSTRSVDAFAPIRGAPMISGLSNTVGTVSLALPSQGNDPLDDAGTSSFFINLGNNASLDRDFTVFAAISDMTVVNQIMALTQVDKSADPNFGGGGLAFRDIPVTAQGFQVFIKRAFVVDDGMTVARAVAGVQSAMAFSQAVAAGEISAESSFAHFAAGVPEPSTLLLAALTAAGLSCTAGRRRR
jgi:cyclophilin family peptidyl-prolyl cis-trans isomerase